ncbi:ATP-binding cassette domain-containing protein [Ideonella sp. B7]|uniref:zinc ABC transporter ATP-binding protein AztA n=1 Tax=Ideonella benzenivorans TaxID=2831643 RepID=UPI001CEC8477|nr:zinc ABC transporter ATP-binding protein AztA [Ideonella benzenivorans]MCA6216438.1 ATP-binding cassette domain-containing protein [Ideonella benzenivorans]
MSPETTASPPSLQLEQVRLCREGRTVLSALTGSFLPGTLTAVIGPNGAGKSTLLEALAGELAPSEGRIVRAPGLRLGYLPQATRLDRQFPLQVQEVVALGLWPHIGPWGGLDGRARQRVDQALTEVGLAGLGQRPLQTLSTGQFQRMLFARLLAQEAQLLLLDEPFAAMDERTTVELLGLLQRWQAQGRTVVAVLHDLTQVREHFSHTLLLGGAQPVWSTTAAALQPAALIQAGYASAQEARCA